MENQIQKNKRTKPFLKWAGGKSQLLSELSKYLPEKYNKYIEPFIGGGALFFFLLPRKAVISDSNKELITTYKIVRDDVEEMIKILENYKNTEEFYYKIRSQDTKNISSVEIAARLYYLNKTCFNGLYRVNMKGKFNVPYGKRNGKFVNTVVLRNASEKLQNTEIIHADYIYTLNKYAKKGDFIYLDPPYYPIGKFADFKRYTKKFFYPEQHTILKKEFDRLVNKGCYVILTNSSHPKIINLYKNYDIKIIETKRLISCNPRTRDGKDIIVLSKNEQ